jgi:hypothetical protein
MKTNLSLKTAQAAEVAGIGYEGFRTWLKRGLLKDTGLMTKFYAPDAPAELADAKRWRWAAFGYADLCSFRLAKNLLDAGLLWETVNPIVSNYSLWKSHQETDPDNRYLVIYAGATEWCTYTSDELVAELDSETRRPDWAILIDLKKLRKDVVLRSRSAALRAVAAEIKKSSHLSVRSGPNLLPPQEASERRAIIESVADDIAQLATEAEQGGASYRMFDARLKQLHGLGMFAENSAISAVAQAFHAECD